jgi:RNA polymerase sigma-70 factor (ECF subfamily)
VADPRLERFFREHFPAIRAKCARLLGPGEEAADVAQETFVRLCESGAVHLPPEPRLRWIYAASTRLAIDVLRRRAVGRRLGLERRDAGPAAHAAEGGERAAQPEPPAPDAPADDALAARRALLALAGATPAEELEVAVLCRVDGLTQPEAAAVCGVSERTVRRLLGRFDARAAGLPGRTP